MSDIHEHRVNICTVKGGGTNYNVSGQAQSQRSLGGQHHSEINKSILGVPMVSSFDLKPSNLLHFRLCSLLDPHRHE